MNININNDGECYKECPNNSSDNNSDYICEDNDIHLCSLSQKEIKVSKENITEEGKESLAKSYVKEFFYTDNHVSMFTYGDKEIVFYKNYECISDLSLGIPKVDLGNATLKFKKDME